MALIEFVDQFYGVSLPSDCSKLVEWYSRMCERPSGQAPNYLVRMLKVARGLPDQTQIFI
jgi:glutathione S-transferase